MIKVKGKREVRYIYDRKKLILNKEIKNYNIFVLSFSDPANDALPYEAAVDVNELVQVEEVMSTQNIGPNGALVYCMELLEANLTWLLEKIKALCGHYLIFDFPGQVFI